MTLIEVKNLKKSYGSIHAVRGISFSVERGEVVGFLGPNGAGKSTTMKLIAGHLRADHGAAIVAGFDISAHPIEAKTHLGYSPEGAPAYGEMTVREFLRFAADLRNLPNPSERVKKTLELCRLNEVAHQTVDTLSKGYRMRLGFAQAVIHDPEVLILDEPTDGLDPNQKFEVRRILKEMASRKAVIVSTHILEEIDELCTRVIVIAHGEVRCDESKEKFLQRGTDLNEVFRKLTA
ncbi:MAG: multidrug ABC transporter ATP-binding protein [Opitutia bacterium]|jgi:ABC-2 type transport system ATP-binding protein|nr:ABC transporter ATP-binding protein [Opitutales bacterium]PHX69262.1 MAG: multidrug ABC transporter ATP-binding protein [Opitutae bacterium]